MLPPVEAASSPSGFQDRKTGLVVFGILTILGGGLNALLVFFMFLGQMMSAKAGNVQSLQMILPGVFMYSGLAVLLVWLGIGSILARRWARALLLIVSWSALIMGVISMAMMTFFLPHISETANAATQPSGQSPLPHSFDLFLIFTLVLMGVLFIVIPLVWILFYQSRNVKATCEACDPVERWTDRCPLPVIALCLWLAFSAAMMLMTAVLFNGVAPAFGIFLSGPMGVGFYVLIGLLWLYCVRAMYRLDPLGWWIVFASMILFCLSAFVTYWHHDLRELYTLMGYPEKQIEELQKFNFFEGRAMPWGTLLAAVPFLAYLLYVRKFFFFTESQQPPATPPLP